MPFKYIFSLLFILSSFQRVKCQSLEKTMNSIGWLVENAQYNKALKKVDSLIVTSSDKKDHYALARAYNLKGTINRGLGKLKDAVHFYNLAIDLNEELKDSFALSGCFSNMGTIYSEMNEYENALKYYFKGIDLIKNNKDPHDVSILYNNIGNIYKNDGKHTLSNHYLKKSLEKALITQDSFLLAMVYHNIGNNMEGVNKHDSAIVLYNQSLAYLNKFDVGIGHIFNYEHIGLSYLLMNKDEEAEKYLLKALEISEQKQIKNELSEIYRALSFSYSRRGNFKLAHKYQGLQLEVKEREFTDNTQAAMRKMEFDNELKHQKKQQLLEQRHKDEVNLAKLDAKNRTIYLFILALAFVLVLIFFVFRSNRQKHKANQIISKQKELVEQKNEEILSSINYAKRIQQTLLAHDEFLFENIRQLSYDQLKTEEKNYFVLFNPKDIVSGDFYWATKTESAKSKKFYLAVCDSTGHGVPGAFMSLLNIGFLSEAINEKGIEKPNEVFNYVRKRLIENISKEGQQDGFDGILICFEKSANSAELKITYSAANNAPVLIQNGHLVDLPCDRMPVGMGVKKEEFQHFTIEAKKGDRIYLPTDGYGDQFGGPKARLTNGTFGQGKKFMYRRLNELFLKIHRENPEVQLSQLKTTFESWRGHLEQVDDVCIIGIQL